MSRLPVLREGPELEPQKGPEARDARQQAYRGNAALVTLGCAKNQVDSEVMLGALAKRGFRIVQDLSQADVAVVNTCGFLQSSAQESIDSILEVAGYKNRGRLRRLIVAGCLVERYRNGIVESLPEVDAFIDTNQILSIADAATGDLTGILEAAARPYFLYDDSMPRVWEGKGASAYVKASEGCDRECAFCIIPKIRGPLRSRSIDSIAQEVRVLGAAGVREVNLVAQDLSAFGHDHGSGSLVSLLRRLDEDAAVDWLRVLYTYPTGISEELLRTIEQASHVVEYLDLPLQHSSTAVLRRMRRPIGRHESRRIVDLIRSTAPSLALRTTFIVGFPGESEDDIADLERFVTEGHFSSVGVFTYSQEEGTPAFELDGQIAEDLKEERRGRIMRAQQEVLERRLEGFVGTELEVLVEGPHDETELLLASRARFQAPDVDGLVLINDIRDGIFPPSPGSIGLVQIDEVSGYDLVGAYSRTLKEGAETRHDLNTN